MLLGASSMAYDGAAAASCTTRGGGVGELQPRGVWALSRARRC
jgi:hypothetical protein